VRVAAAVVISLGVLVGSALAVAQSADTSGATRARLLAVMGDELQGDDCGCTAPARAKERAARLAATRANDN